jgi:hypothetical protein
MKLKDSILGRSIKSSKGNGKVVGCITILGGKVDFFIGLEETPKCTELLDGSYYSILNGIQWIPEEEVIVDKG